MSDSFTWDTDDRSMRFQRCQSSATNWVELKPALVAAWVRFAEILDAGIPADLRSEIVLSFFSSSGRITWGHKQREHLIVNYKWESTPTDYMYTIDCSSKWVEDQWYAVDGDDDAIETALGQLGVNLAMACLEAAAHPLVAMAFQPHRVDNILVIGQGVTQSPARFEINLAQLLAGRLPMLLP